MLDSTVDASASPLSQVISVAELNRIARKVLERHLPLMWVAGEISNCKRYDSGHCYFTLKDANAQVDCVMFRTKVQLLGWTPQDGMQVEVRGCATLYEARGKFQLTVEAMRRSGLGALYEAFARLKTKLESEGLFDPARKRPLPSFPHTIGIVTSREAAALRDVLTTLRRRMPGLPAIVYPTPVQGGGAARSIAAAIRTASARAECDVLLVCRGGGSIEDLWAYNEEIVARAIVACAVPVVTGIGHETDFTIADFAADCRAPTPTGAAERVSPDREDLVRLLTQTTSRLGRCMLRGLENRMQQVDYLTRRLTHPGERIRTQLAELGHLARRLESSMRYALENHVWRMRDLGQRLVAGTPDLRALAAANADLARRLVHAARRRLETAATAIGSAGVHLRHLSPQHVLDRGYSIAETDAGTIVRDGSQLANGEQLKITFARGWARAEVKQRGEREG